MKRIIVDESEALLRVSPGSRHYPRLRRKGAGLDGKSLLCIGKKVQKIALESNQLAP